MKNTFEMVFLTLLTGCHFITSFFAYTPNCSKARGAMYCAYGMPYHCFLRLLAVERECSYAEREENVCMLALSHKIGRCLWANIRCVCVVACVK